MRAIMIKNKEKQDQSICKSRFLDNRQMWGPGEMTGTSYPKPAMQTAAAKTVTCSGKMDSQNHHSSIGQLIKVTV